MGIQLDESPAYLLICEFVSFDLFSGRRMEEVDAKNDVGSNGNNHDETDVKFKQ